MHFLAGEVLFAKHFFSLMFLVIPFKNSGNTFISISWKPSEQFDLP
jgi:hypothetical protein